MASPDQYHLARKTPASIATESDPGIDMERLCRYRLERVREQLHAHDLAGCLLYDPINIRYATGSRNMSVYTMHAAERYAFVTSDGPVILFDSYPVVTPAIVDERRPAQTWYYEVTGDNTFEACRKWAAEIADIVSQQGDGNTRIGIDRMGTLGFAALQKHDLELCDGEAVLEKARLIKSAEEIACMSASVGVCDAGMARMREALRPGISENYLWSILAQTNIEFGGEWLECRLLASGGRTNPWYQEASDKLIRSGDLVAFDTDMVGPYGYCADISRSFHCGPAKPTPRQKELYRMAYDQVHHNMALIKPGVGFRELSEKSWRGPVEFEENRYVCMVHGVGLVDEYPDIAHPLDWDKHGYDGVIEENMALCVESYIGQSGDSEGGQARGTGGGHSQRYPDPVHFPL